MAPLETAFETKNEGTKQREFGVNKMANRKWKMPF